jgi:hypothetical protein
MLKKLAKFLSFGIVATGLGFASAAAIVALGAWLGWDPAVVKQLQLEVGGAVFAAGMAADAYFDIGGSVLRKVALREQAYALQDAGRMPSYKALSRYVQASFLLGRVRSGLGAASAVAGNSEQEQDLIDAIENALPLIKHTSKGQLPLNEIVLDDAQRTWFVDLCYRAVAAVRAANRQKRTRWFRKNLPLPEKEVAVELMKLLLDEYSGRWILTSPLGQSAQKEEDAEKLRAQELLKQFRAEMGMESPPAGDKTLGRKIPV